jgi:hypothetical protein
VDGPRLTPHIRHSLIRKLNIELRQSSTCIRSFKALFISLAYLNLLPRDSEKHAKYRCRQMSMRTLHIDNSTDREVHVLMALQANHPAQSCYPANVNDADGSRCSVNQTHVFPVSSTTLTRQTSVDRPMLTSHINGYSLLMQEQTLDSTFIARAIRILGSRFISLLSRRTSSISAVRLTNLLLDPMIQTYYYHHIYGDPINRISDGDSTIHTDSLT